MVLAQTILDPEVTALEAKPLPPRSVLVTFEAGVELELPGLGFEPFPFVPFDGWVVLVVLPLVPLDVPLVALLVLPPLVPLAVPLVALVPLVGGTVELLLVPLVVEFVPLVGGTVLLVLVPLVVAFVVFVALGGKVELPLVPFVVVFYPTVPFVALVVALVLVPLVVFTGSLTLDEDVVVAFEDEEVVPVLDEDDVAAFFEMKEFYPEIASKRFECLSCFFPWATCPCLTLSEWTL